MAEKSGIEMIEELLEEVKLLHKKVDVLDRNMKQIANSTKMAELIDRASGTKFEAYSNASSGKGAQIKPVDAKEEVARLKEKNKQSMRFKFEPMDASKVKGKTPPEKRARVTTPKPSNIMVKGKMVISEGGKSIPLSQIQVTIFDAKDNVVKETKTNRAGHWMSQLPPGQYVAKFEGEYEGKKLAPVNKAFDVPKEMPPGQKEIEVQ